MNRATVKSYNNILQLLYPWRSRLDAEACQLDLSDYGQAFALLVDGHLQRIPLENIVMWKQPAPDTYAESG